MTAHAPTRGVPRRLRTAAAALLGLLLAGCATPGTRLGEIAASAQLSPVVDLDSTPFYPQTDRMCGPAALATVLGAAGRTTAPELLERQTFLPGRAGTLQPEVLGAIRARGLLAYELGPTLEELMAELGARRPVLVLQRQGLGPWPAWHYAVLVGYDAERGTVLLRSGTTRRLELRASVFEATWARGGHWAVVAIEPGLLPARPDLVRYLRAAGALESMGRLEAARAAYGAAGARWPREPLPLLGLANLEAARGRWTEAERGYATVLALAPDSAAALNNRAEALARLGCVATARRVLDAGASRVAPDDPLRATLERTRAELEAQRPSTPEPAACAGHLAE